MVRTRVLRVAVAGDRHVLVGIDSHGRYVQHGGELTQAGAHETPGPSLVTSCGIPGRRDLYNADTRGVPTSVLFWSNRSISTGMCWYPVSAASQKRWVHS